MGRILGLDYGTKRIGVAISDETKKIATARPFVPANRKKDLLKIIQEFEIETVVLGLPKNLTGKETAAAARVREFAEWIKTQTGLPVKFADERFSARDAGSKLRMLNVKGSKARAQIDSLSAQIILTTYLQKIKDYRL